MFDYKKLEKKLKEIEEEYKSLNRKISQPENISDSEKYTRLLKKHAHLKQIVDKFKEYQSIKQQIKEAEPLLDGEDEEMKELASMEMEELTPRQEKIEKELPFMLLPNDPDDKKNVIVEIRAGAGGDEAALFAADLFRMYNYYSENNNWEIEVMKTSSSGVGGFKEIIFSVAGKNVYKFLKYESGVHRVQRVPSTESSGRIHTSTATVAVLPEAEEVDIEIEPNDLRIDFYRSSGPGGQSVNTPDSAVRITHIPTDLTVSCQDEKSQHKNKARAMRILRARVKEKIENEKQAERAENRKSQIGSGDRSEKIRTYNFPQGRVSDHRINLTVHQLEKILDGELDLIINKLIEEDNAEKLANL